MDESSSEWMLLDGTSVKVTEYLKPFNPELVGLILNFAEVNARQGYEANYKDDPKAAGTLSWLFATNQLIAIYVCHINGEFAYFSGIREVEGDAMLGVRLISAKRDGHQLPYHPAFVIPVQIRRARMLGYRRCFVSYNVGIRTSFYKMILRLRQSSSGNQVVKMAKETLLPFIPQPIRVINTIEQHSLVMDL
jgi:hypothetical protein